LPNHTNILDDDLFSNIVPHCTGRCTYFGNNDVLW
jgi:hypothetical protein